MVRTDLVAAMEAAAVDLDAAIGAVGSARNRLVEAQTAARREARIRGERTNHVEIDSAIGSAIMGAGIRINSRVPPSSRPIADFFLRK